MARGKMVSLKGEAARAFIMMQAGHKPQTERDELAMIATRVYMELHAVNMDGAVAILRAMKDGGDTAVQAIVKERGRNGG